MPKKSKGFLIATFENFPGVSIPLLSEEECKARGIEQRRFPHFDTWTPEQKAAGRRLSKILAKMAITQAMRSIFRHLEAMQSENYTGNNLERDSIERAIAEVRAGKWKAGKGDTSGLEKEMIHALETILSDLDPPPSSSTSSQPGAKSGSARKRGSRAASKAQR
jgi:hypothetical protein